MNKKALVDLIKQRRSFLCVGLDLDPSKLPLGYGDDEEGWLHFNRQIIESTKDLCVAYKPNWAFYEALGERGMRVLKATLDLIRGSHLIIADAKRGDIGNTSSRYAQAIFEEFEADAITVAPYMGIDSLKPFERKGKWLVALGLTSNLGSSDFQQLELASGEKLYESVLRKLGQSFSPEEMMFVIGATHPEVFSSIRNIVPDHFFLVPGIGAQGGDLEGVCQHGINDEIGLLINSSRSIIYAGQGEDFGDAAREEAKKIQIQMMQYV